jgi:hypothetical protein
MSKPNLRTGERDGVGPCRAAGGEGWRLAGRRGERSCHILVAGTGSSETWHGRLGPRIADRRTPPLPSGLLRRRWCCRCRRCRRRRRRLTPGMPSGLSSPPPGAGVAGIWGPEFASALWGGGGIREDPIQSGAAPPRTGNRIGARARAFNPVAISTPPFFFSFRLLGGRCLRSRGSRSE